MKTMLITALCLFVYTINAQRPPLPDGRSNAPAPAQPLTFTSHVLGNPAIDAHHLVTQLRTNQLAEIIRILSFYAPKRKDRQPTAFSSIETMVLQNNFLRPLLESKLETLRAYFEANETALNKQIEGLTDSGTQINGVAASIFPAQRIADGLGTFIAERFKEELTQRYLQAFRDSIIFNDSKYFYSILLPKTYMSLVKYENIFDYKSFMTALREAFKDDLDNLAGNSLRFVDKLKDQNVIVLNDHVYYLAYYLADFAVNELPDGSSPVLLFQNFDDYQYKDRVNTDVAGAIRIVGVFAQNLTNNTGAGATANDINTLIRNPEALLAFCGLVLEKERVVLSENIQIRNTSAYNWLNTQTSADIAVIIRSIATVQRDAESFARSDRKLPDMINLASKLGPEVRSLLIHAQVMSEPEAESIFGVVDHVINISEYSIDQKYGLMVTETLELFADLKLEQTLFYKNFKKYGLFISNVAQAENSQQVKEALDIAALPVGSYKIKRNALSDISLNAFPGLFGGVEFRNNVPEGLAPGVDIYETVGTAGFTAPVGLAFSWGMRSKKGDNATTINVNEYEVVTRSEDGTVQRATYYINGRSHSLFLSIIDVGAITSFRLADDDTETLPEFTWNNILAPAVYYVKGMKNTPLSWGLGIQYGPQLRSIDDTDLELSGSMVSVRAFLTVDVPVFNFFTRTTPRSKRVKVKTKK